MMRRVTVWMNGRRTVPRVLLALAVVMLLASALWAGSVAAQDPVPAQTPVPPVASPPGGPAVLPSELPDPSSYVGLGGGGVTMMAPVGNAQCPNGIGNLATTGSNQVVGSYVASPADGMGTVTVTVTASGYVPPIVPGKDPSTAAVILDSQGAGSNTFSVSISSTPASGGVVVQTAANGTGPRGALLAMTFSTATAFDVIVNAPSGGTIQWAVVSEGGGCFKAQGGGAAP